MAGKLGEFNQSVEVWLAHGDVAVALLVELDIPSGLCGSQGFSVQQQPDPVAAGTVPSGGVVRGVFRGSGGHHRVDAGGVELDGNVVLETAGLAGVGDALRAVVPETVEIDKVVEVALEVVVQDLSILDGVVFRVHDIGRGPSDESTKGR